MYCLQISFRSLKLVGANLVPPSGPIQLHYGALSANIPIPLGAFQSIASQTQPSMLLQTNSYTSSPANTQSNWQQNAQQFQAGFRKSFGRRFFLSFQSIDEFQSLLKTCALVLLQEELKAYCVLSLQKLPIGQETGWRKISWKRAPSTQSQAINHVLTSYYGTRPDLQEEVVIEAMARIQVKAFNPDIPNEIAASNQTDQNEALLERQRRRQSSGRISAHSPVGNRRHSSGRMVATTGFQGYDPKSMTNDSRNQPRLAQTLVPALSSTINRKPNYKPPLPKRPSSGAFGHTAPIGFPQRKPTKSTSKNGRKSAERLAVTQGGQGAQFYSRSEKQINPTNQMEQKQFARTASSALNNINQYAVSANKTEDEDPPVIEFVNDDQSDSQRRIYSHEVIPSPYQEAEVQPLPKAGQQFLKKYGLVQQNTTTQKHSAMTMNEQRRAQIKQLAQQTVEQMKRQGQASKQAILTGISRTSAQEHVNPNSYAIGQVPTPSIPVMMPVFSPRGTTYTLKNINEMTEKELKEAVTRRGNQKKKLPSQSNNPNIPRSNKSGTPGQSYVNVPIPMHAVAAKQQAINSGQYNPPQQAQKQISISKPQAQNINSKQYASAQLNSNQSYASDFEQMSHLESQLEVSESGGLQNSYGNPNQLRDSQSGSEATSSFIQSMMLAGGANNQQQHNQQIAKPISSQPLNSGTSGQKKPASSRSIYEQDEYDEEEFEDDEQYDDENA